MSDITDREAEVEDGLIKVIEQELDAHMLSQDDLPKGFVIDLADRILKYIRYEDFIQSELELDRLHANGVDNWEGY